jgi:hypothetical protein
MMYVCHVHMNHMWYGCTRTYTYIHVTHVKHVMICGDGTRRMSCVAIFIYLHATLHVVRVVPGTCVVLKCTYICVLKITG